MNNEVLIFAELTPAFKISQVAFELAGVAKNLTNKIDNSKLSAVIINKICNYDKIVEELKNTGFDKVYLIKNDIYKEYSTELYTNAICELIKEIQPKVMLFGATRTGRDLAPRVSSRLNLGLTADCTGLDITEDGNLAATRPTFGGNLMATILSKSPTQMATVRPNVFSAKNNQPSENIKIEEKFYHTTHAIDKVELLKFIPFNSSQKNALTEAQIVVAGGKGMKNEKGFALLQEFADLINAQVGASRQAVNMGLAESSIQIGQTGKTVMPKIYIACGISGAIQHIVGMNMADKIIAINNDANAPIFKYADYGIVGDAFEIIPQIMEIIKDNKQE